MKGAVAETARMGQVLCSRVRTPLFAISYVYSRRPQELEGLRKQLSKQQKHNEQIAHDADEASC